MPFVVLQLTHRTRRRYKAWSTLNSRLAKHLEPYAGALQAYQERKVQQATEPAHSKAAQEESEDEGSSSSGSSSSSSSSSGSGSSKSQVGGIARAQP